MKEQIFETNIMCGSCVAKATPALDEALGAGNWRVDASHKKKLLYAPATADKENVIAAAASAGFEARPAKRSLF